MNEQVRFHEDPAISNPTHEREPDSEYWTGRRGFIGHFRDGLNRPHRASMNRAGIRRPLRFGLRVHRPSGAGFRPFGHGGRLGGGAFRFGAPHRGGRGRWGWMQPGGVEAPALPDAVAAPPPPPPQPEPGGPADPMVAQAQACLAQIGFPVPQNGVMGPATQRAVRLFQGARGLAASGQLDDQTNAVLQSVCGGGPPDAAAADGGAPDAGAGGDAPPDAPQGEWGYGVSSGSSQSEELFVHGPCNLQVQMSAKTPVANDSQLTALPDKPGVYIIYENNEPWHVGVAEKSIRGRFLERLKALKDFNVPDSVLANKQVAWATVNGNAPVCGLRRKAEGGTGKPAQVGGADASLKVLKQFFIAQLGTNRTGKGNRRGELVRVSGTEPLSISIRGPELNRDFSYAPRAVPKGQPATVAFDAKRQNQP